MPRRPGDRGRTATVCLKAGAVTIERPRHGAAPAEPPALLLTRSG